MSEWRPARIPVTASAMPEPELRRTHVRTRSKDTQIRAGKLPMKVIGDGNEAEDKVTGVFLSVVELK
jgi:hypothetical protein